MIKWKENIRSDYPSFGWVLILLMPANHEECTKNKIDFTDWINDFGFEKAWINNGKIYHSGHHDKRSEDVTSRVLCFAEIPELRENIRKFLT